MRFLRPVSLMFGAFALVCACSGGGSQSAPGTYVEFALSSTTAVEGGPAVGVSVRLITDQPELGRDAVVLLRNAGTGNALVGFDVAAFGEIELTFATGTTTGAEQVVWFTPLDDTLVEGADELLRLELAYDSGGAAIGPRRTHKLQIVDADVATFEFQLDSFATSDESAQGVPVAIGLTLPPATTLATSLHVRVSDAGTGTASHPSDYANFAASTLDFAAGAASGTTAQVLVTIKEDDDVEGAETIVLALASPSIGAQIGPRSAHTLTITDDDLLAAAQIAVHSGGTSLSNGATVDVGGQTSGAGPNAGIVVEVENPGVSPLALDLPLIQGPDERDFSLELITSAGAGSPELGVPARASPLRRGACRASGASVLEIDLATLAEATDAEHVAWVGFPLPGDVDGVLEVEQLPWPWTDDAVLALDGEQLAAPTSSSLGELTLWRGHVVGEAASDVFLALSHAGARGWISTGAERVLIEPLLDQPGRSLAAPESELRELAATFPNELCTEALAPDELDAPPGAPEGAASGTSLALCRLALESDHQLFQRLGSVETLGAYVTALVAASSARYQIDAQTELAIAYLGMHAHPGDGWSTPDQPGTTSQMLDEFRVAWAPSLGGAWPASANLAHFLSGATLGGGIAYLGVLCNPNWGFGVSGNLNGAIDWTTWSGASSPIAWDFVVFTHELGHNFAAAHTHSYCPPLDRCYTNCEGPNLCSTGTLMSYCHLCSGGISNIELYFHPFIANVMRSAVNTSCLGGASVLSGERLLWRVRFAPTSGGGPRTATLTFEHAADNTPTPFELELEGTAFP